MIPLDQLALPAAIIERLKAAGFGGVEELCQTRWFDLRRMGFTEPEFQEIRAALRKIGWDFPDPMDDPSKSVYALEFIFDRLNFTPGTGKSIKYFLNGIITLSELRERIPPMNRDAVERFLELLGYGS